MYNKAQDQNTDSNNSNNGNDGFVWSQRLTVITGVVVAIALAAIHYAPILAGPLEWGH
jgi:hypothetical protein